MSMTNIETGLKKRKGDITSVSLGQNISHVVYRSGFKSDAAGAGLNMVFTVKRRKAWRICIPIVIQSILF